MQDEDTTTRHRGGKVILTNVQFKCTDCKRWKGGDQFGLRKMANGEIRNQPQCKVCRGVYKKPRA